MSVRSSPKRTIQLGDDDARFMAGADAAGGQRAYIVGLMDAAKVAGQWRMERPPNGVPVLVKGDARRGKPYVEMFTFSPGDHWWQGEDRWAPLPTEPRGD